MKKLDPESRPMLVYFKLVGTLVFWATLWALLGGVGCENAGRDPWVGVMGGGVFEIFVGLIVGG